MAKRLRAQRQYRKMRGRSEHPRRHGGADRDLSISASFADAGVLAAPARGRLRLSGPARTRFRLEESPQRAQASPYCREIGALCRSSGYAEAMTKRLSFD